MRKDRWSNIPQAGVRVGDFSGKVEGKVGLVEVGWLVRGIRLQHAGKINICELVGVGWVEVG